MHYYAPCCLVWAHTVREEGTQIETQVPGLAIRRGWCVPGLAPSCKAQASSPGLGRGGTCIPHPHTSPPSTRRGPGSRRPTRRKRRPYPAACPPAAAHPGSAPAAPRTAGSAPAAPRGSEPSPAPRGGHTGRGTATTTLRVASSRACSCGAHFPRKFRLCLHSRIPCRHCFRGWDARRCQGNYSAVPHQEGNPPQLPNRRIHTGQGFSNFILF